MVIRGIMGALIGFMITGNAVAPRSHAADLPAFDFTQSRDAQGWGALHDIARLTPTADGLRVTISGSDPYLHGPARNYPAGVALWLKLRLKSDQGGSCQVF